MLTLVILWLLFFISHSLLAATAVKNFFAKTLKNGFKYYRFVYSVISLLLILAIVLELWRGESEDIFESIAFFQYMGATLLMAGLYVMVAAFKRIDFFTFLGLSTKEESPTGLITEGWYKVVRHPLYWGIFLFLNGILFIKPTGAVLLSVVLSIIYIIIGIEFEEKKLRQTYGQAYDDYAFKKKKFIPLVY